jgi:hypothetical protein
MEPEEITLEPFDLFSMTVAEALSVEMVSGVEITRLTRTTSGKLLVAAYVQLWRSSGQPPNWQELTSRRLLDISPGRSRSKADSQSPKSSG